MAVMIHRLSDVQTDTIGEGTRIWQFAVVLPGAKIGSECNINCNCFIENDVVIGDNVTVKSGVFIWDGIRLEDDVFIGPCVAFTNDLFPRSKRYPEEFVTTIVGKGASIGANSTIIAGRKIGAFALIGAGSVVSKDVPPYAMFYGNPARLRGYVCECGSKLPDDFICSTCSREYKFVGDELTRVAS